MGCLKGFFVFLLNILFFFGYLGLNIYGFVVCLLVLYNLENISFFEVFCLYFLLKGVIW